MGDITKILITGGSGFLGKHLALELSKLNEVIITSRNQKMLFDAAKITNVESAPQDVSNYNATFEIFSRYKPDIVIHAAASKFVGLSEKFPNECIDTNVRGSQNVARAAIATGVQHVIGISTDKATSPIANIYGVSKATMERLFLSLNNTSLTQFSCVRYGNVAWSTGSVFPLWQKMLEGQNEIVTTGPDMSRFFFSIYDAVRLVSTAVTSQDVYGKILSLPMKGVYIHRVLDAFTKQSNSSWRLGDRREGDRNLEFLISDFESVSTVPIVINDQNYFMLSLDGKELVGHLPQAYSSINAEQLSDEEITTLVNHRPKLEMM